MDYFRRREEARPRGRRRRRRSEKRGVGFLAVLAGLLVFAVIAAGAVGAAAFGVGRATYESFRDSCSIERATARRLGETSFVYAADGTYLGAIHHDYYRQVVPLDEISPWLQKATVAVEDRRFHEHVGVDPEGIARAAVRNIEARQIVEGGSTLTQQVVKMLYLSSERSWDRKVEEACLALQLEERWSKEQILGVYLNRAFYGHRAYGAQAAAQTYFGIAAKDLGPAQAATIAGLPQAPSAYDPITNPERALRRRNDVLRAMRDMGELPQEAYEKAVAQPLNLRPGYVYEIRRAPYFFDYVRRQLVEAYGEDRIRRGGLKVHTTLDPRYQSLARRAIRRNLDLPGDPASSIVSVDPRNGAIRAMTQIVPSGRLQFNVAFQGPRQVGSAFKTFVLVEAMRQGMNPFATTYDSAPFSYDPGPGQDLWKPKTYSGTYYGPSTVTQATLRSDNVVYARLTIDTGPANVVRTAKRMGIDQELEPVASIGLGPEEVTVLEMAEAYATLAAMGVHREPYAIEKVELPNGKVDEAPWGPAEAERALPHAVAWHATQILRQNVVRGTGTGAQIGRNEAGKTGTTDKHTDAWFVGYTPKLATAVWVGYPAKKIRMLNVHGIRVAGGTFPAQIWGDYMRPALRGEPVAGYPRHPRGSWEWQQWDRRYAGADSGSAEDEDVESDAR